MGFLSDLKLKREQKKLETQLEEAPTPEVFRKLAELYVNEFEDLHKGVEYAEQGIGRFPDDKPLKNTFDKYSKIQLKQDIDAIEKKVFNFPSASLFIKLSEKYFQYGDSVKAFNYAQTCMKEYPDKCAPYIVMGRIFKQKGEPEKAMKMFEKATMLENYNYDGLMEFGRVLEETGDLSRALSTFKTVLSFAPGDTEANERTKELLTKVPDTPAPPSSETEMIFQAEEETPFNIDFSAAPVAEEEKISETKEPPALPPELADADIPPLPQAVPQEAPPKAAGGDSVMDELMGLLVDFKNIDGVEGSILIDKYGLAIAEDVDSSFDSDLLAAVLTNILRTIKQHSGATDFGIFENGFVETETRNIHLYSIKDVELVLFSSPSTRLGLLEMKVNKFIEKFIELETRL